MNSNKYILSIDIYRRRKYYRRFYDLVYKIPTPILVWLNICPYCLHHSATVAKRRTRTLYKDEESNYETSCVGCYEEHDEYWKERWNEYYMETM